MGAILVSRLSNRGNTFVDYLLLSLVVAGIAVPLVMRFFGDPIRKTLFDNRQVLVDFLAQSPKRSVPNIWFAQERAAALKDPAVTGPQNIAEPGDLGSGPSLSDPGTLQQPNVSGPGEIKDPNLNDPGSASSVGGATGGPLAGTSGATGGSSSSSGDLSSDFFNTPEAMTGTDEMGSTANTRSANPTSVSASDGTASANRDDTPAGQKKDKRADDDSSQKSDSQTRRYQNEELARMAEAERAGQRAFNWWLIIKILIVLAIFFLVMLIILGNARKR